MDLTQLANLGEFIGGVAVLATLIYLAVQVRTSALEQRVTAAREATRELAGVLQTVVTTSERAELFLAGMTDISGLEPAQRLRFSAIVGHLAASSSSSSTKIRLAGWTPRYGRALTSSCTTSLPTRESKRGGPPEAIGTEGAFASTSIRI